MDVHAALDVVHVADPAVWAYANPVAILAKVLSAAARRRGMDHKIVCGGRPAAVEVGRVWTGAIGAIRAGIVPAGRWSVRGGPASGWSVRGGPASGWSVRGGPA